jgi:hypothetical protein
MRKKAFFYIWLLPVIWCILAVLSFFNSGDEHALFAFGTWPATGLLFLIRAYIVEFEVNKLVDILPWALLTGVILISLASLLLDWLRAGKKLFLILFVVGVIILFSYSFKAYGSFEKMASKHRSVFAVVVFVCHLSLYMSIVVSAVVAAAQKLPFFRKSRIDKSN